MAAHRKRRRVERHDGYRLVVGGPVPPQAAGITLGRTICVRPGYGESDALIAHELVHVRQFGELGRARFLVRYVRSYLRGRLAGYGHMAAYRRIPLEVEASWLSRLHSRSDLEPGVPGVAAEVTKSRSPRVGFGKQLPIWREHRDGASRRSGMSRVRSTRDAHQERARNR